jgi:Type II secretion system (T2SS), protein M subtype b
MSFEIALSHRRQQALALALATVPVLAIVAVSVCLALSWSAHHARVALLMTERANYRRAIDEAPALRSAMATLRSSEAANDYFFASGQSSAAAAKVRSQIGAIVGGDGATIARDDVELAAAGDDSPVELRASISFTGDIKSLTRVLYHLRQARPLLFVTQLAVHSFSDGTNLTAPNRLQADLVVEAYLGTP